MSDLLIYLLKSSLCLGAIALLYRFILKGGTHFTWDRIFLLASLSTALLLPTINLHLQVSWLGSGQAEVLPQIQLDGGSWEFFADNSTLTPYTGFLESEGMLGNISPTQSPESTPFPWLPPLLLSIWGLPALLKLGRLLHRLYKLHSWSQNREASPIPSLSWVFLPGGSGSFTWFRTIFIDPDELQTAQTPYILAHESTHAKQWHSLDVLFFELAEIAFWFHPALYYLKKELRDTHEFLADRQAAGANPLQYSKVLLMLAQKSHRSEPAIAFAGSRVGDRIHMLNKQRSNAMSKIKYLLLLPLLGLFISAFSLVPLEKSDTRNLSLPVYEGEKEGGIAFAGERVPVENPLVREKLEEAYLQLKYKPAVAALALRRMQKWQGFLLERLRKEGLPDDFIFLPLAESLLDLQAESPAGAKGMWQIMPKTGKELGLIQNEYVDQRMDVEAATQAASQYLKKAKKQLGNWTSAAAAYNRGIPGLIRDQKQQKSESYYHLFLSKETNGYLYRILAFKYLVLHPQLYGMDLQEVGSTSPWDLKSKNIEPGSYFLPDLAKQHETSFAELMHLNPWLVHPQFQLKVVPGQTFRIHVPEFSDRAIDEAPQMYPLKSAKREVTSHFGFTRSPFGGKERFHRGIDLKAPQGEAVIAPADAKVIKVDNKPDGYGIHVILQHGKRYESLFAHLSKALVQEGATVKKGQEIGKVGSTGLSTGPHLHYEIRELGFPVDPIDFMD